MSSKHSEIYVGDEKHHRRGRPRASEGHSHATVPPRLGVYPTYRSRGAVFATSSHERRRRRRRTIALVSLTVAVLIAAAFLVWTRVIPLP